jgi:formylglycine-generating enzyme required for sulfatase activity
VGDATSVGSYTGSAGPYGTFDQGGNVSEWNEGKLSGGLRRLRGGSHYTIQLYLASDTYVYGNYATYESGDTGFRVAMIPEPSTVLLLATGLAGLAAAGRRRSIH